MNEVIYKGAVLRFKFNFDIPSEEAYMLVECHESGYVFQLVCISGFKSGSIGGYIKPDLKISDENAITKSHLEIELGRNFLNFEKETLEIIRQLELEDFPTSSI